MNTHVRIAEEAWAERQYQDALAVISSYRARDWEAKREAREAGIRQRMADWLHYADQCEVRAREYDRWASEYPASHHRHHHYTALAADQRRRKAEAMRSFRIERDSL